MEKIQRARLASNYAYDKTAFWSRMAKNSVQRIVLTALGGSVATDEKGLTAEVVVVSVFDELNELGREKVEEKSFYSM